MKSGYVLPCSSMLGHCGWLDPLGRPQPLADSPLHTQAHRLSWGPRICSRSVLAFSRLGAIIVPGYPLFGGNNLILVGFVIYCPSVYGYIVLYWNIYIHTYIQLPLRCHLFSARSWLLEDLQWKLVPYLSVNLYFSLMFSIFLLSSMNLFLSSALRFGVKD